MKPASNSLGSAANIRSSLILSDLSVIFSKPPTKTVSYNPDCTPTQALNRADPPDAHAASVIEMGMLRPSSLDMYPGMRPSLLVVW